LFTLSASSDEVANEWISAIESKLKTFSTEQDIKDKKEVRKGKKEIKRDKKRGDR
jgi:hypothetical protein